ncbi:AMP-binding protein [Streptomyces sp. NPDC050788]|uniref:AMP-binding protein n=1 Tax=Streptomyces sp. NPDC050788 TaxID=3155041 RepID=UPI003416F577
MSVPGAPDWSILDIDPLQQTVTDADAYVRTLMQWHFGTETGSPFWLRRRAELNFDPLTDVKTVEDLAQFPNVVDEFRDIAAEDLVPRGLGDSPKIAAVFESGGTTGRPKRFVMFEDWFTRYLAWAGRKAASGLGGSGINLLATTPSGPHMIGEVTVRQSHALGGKRFTIDIDPRWVKKLIERGQRDELRAYVDHLVDQTADILATQDVGMIQTIPILLTKIAERPELVDLVRSKVKRIAWGGAHMDPDTRAILREEVFPGIPIVGGYGSTTILSVAVERKEEQPSGLATFDPFSPYVFFRVVDPDTGRPVAHGERGQIVMNHITKFAFIPNNLERDTAIRVPAEDGHIGDAVADVAPVKSFDGTNVTEGVY